MNYPLKPTEFYLISRMNEAFGNPRGIRANFDRNANPEAEKGATELSWLRVQRQLRNIRDEINELREAIETGDPLKVRDSLCDIRVFANGGHHFMGYDPDYMPVEPVVDRRQDGLHNFLATIEPVTALMAAYHYLMRAVEDWAYESTNLRIAKINWLCYSICYRLGMSKEEMYRDMRAVIDGVMTRFVKDDYDLGATKDLHYHKGVTETYTEGSFPTMILKSAADQPDAPQGKFLKSASYQDTVFPSILNPAALENCIGELRSLL